MIIWKIKVSHLILTHKKSDGIILHFSGAHEITLENVFNNLHQRRVINQFDKIELSNSNFKMELEFIESFLSA